MKIVLSAIKEHNNPEEYKNTLQSLYGGFSLLKQVTIKFETNIDGGIVNLVLNAVKEKASRKYYAGNIMSFSFHVHIHPMFLHWVFFLESKYYLMIYYFGEVPNVVDGIGIVIRT